MAALDENLYSRQLYVYGKDAMKSITSANVLICGMNGLGVEIAKNIILSGVGSVTLCDKADRILIYDDLSTNYYANESDVGKQIINVSIDSLTKLNEYVTVKKLVLNDDLTEEIINQFSIVIATTDFFTQHAQINNMASNVGIQFIGCTTYGAYGHIFCDFGNEFKVNDMDGEEAKNGLIINLEKNKEDDKNIIIMYSAEDHELLNGNIVSFTNPQLEHLQVPIKLIDLKKFRIEVNNDDYEKINNTQESFTFFQIKEKCVVSHKSLNHYLEQPVCETFGNINMLDVCNMDKSISQHAFYMAALKFINKHHNLPRVWNADDAEEIYQLVLSFYPEAENNKQFIELLSKTMDSQTIPTVSVIGSIVAQEIIKGSTHKYMPLDQFYYFESMDSLTSQEISFNDTTCDQTNRYKNQIALFGNELNDKIRNSNIFLVGAGAIGCEHAKNMAMMGIGNLTVTDMDTIEKSNLSRQFLFRNDNIGQFKSDVLGKAVNKMNPDVNVISQQNKVGSETVHIYNDKFFDSLTCVTNALDNVQARLFVDSLCIASKKPLLESGTLGTKCNVQAIVPNLTDSYGSTSDPPEKSIPVCTLKNFPYNISHCIQWARDMFEGYFSNAPTNAIKFLKSPKEDNFLRSLTGNFKETVQEIDLVLDEIPESYYECVELGYRTYHEMFRDQIIQLQHKYPKDATNSDGEPFWVGTKRYPSYIPFDANNENHINFVFSFANLWAYIHGLQLDESHTIDLCKKYTEQFTIPFFVPSDETNNDISGNDAEEAEKNKTKETANISDDKIVDKMIEKHKNKKSSCIYPISFEKDDDTNYHIDFITAASNLRAFNYGIEQADKHRTKGIAGKIIPAIATTTALVSGLVMFELLKIINNKDKLTDYRNWFCNLAVPYTGCFEPTKAKQQKIGNLEFTFWDSFEFRNDPLLSDIIDHYQEKYDMEISTVTYGQYTLLTPFLMPKKRQDKMKKHISELIMEVTKKSKDELGTSVSLGLFCNNDSDDDDSDEESNQENENIPVCKVFF